MSNCDIIVVDNENIEFFLLWLSNLGYTVKGFNSGKEAVGWLKLFEARLAIIDLAMDEMDGLTTVREISSMPHLDNLEIWFMSGHKFDANIMRIASNYGVFKFLEKPFDLPLVEIELKELLSKHP